MGQLIDEALGCINAGTAEGTWVLREALEIIEKPYACSKIHMVHELLLSNEEYGGEMEDAVQLLLTDIELWKRRGYRLQAEKKTSHTDNIISIIIATILCAVALYVLDAMSRMFPGTVEPGYIFRTGVIQVTSILFILGMIHVMVKSQRTLTANWLQTESLFKEEYLLASYNTCRNYNEAKEKRKSLIFATPFLLGAVAAFFFQITWLGVLAVVIGAFMLMQHRVGYRLARKDVNAELYLSLPQWLMDMALLMQNNNVQVSIAKSVQEAPVILRQELNELLERLEAAPDRLKSYTDFCKDFDIPEAQTCMKMLHAISEIGRAHV